MRLYKNALSEKNLRKFSYKKVGRESDKELDGNEMDNNMTMFDISCIRLVFEGDKNTIGVYICLWW